VREDHIEQKMLRWTVVSVCVGVLGVLIAALALANDLGYVDSGGGGPVAADTSAPSNGGLSPDDGQDDEGETSSPGGSQDAGIDETTTASAADGDSEDNADAAGENTGESASPGIWGAVAAFFTERVWKSDLPFWPALWHVTMVLLTISAVFAAGMVALVLSRLISDVEAAGTGLLGFAVIGVGVAAVAVRAFIDEGIWVSLAFALVPLAQAAVAGLATVIGTVALALRLNLRYALRLVSIQEETTPTRYSDGFMQLTPIERERARVETIKQLTPARRQQLLQDVVRLHDDFEWLRRRRVYKDRWQAWSRDIDELQQAFNIAETELHSRLS
jgi:hypothetical protein